jgi:hypothetical protein
MVMGVDNFMNILNDKYYTGLKGGIMEALGKLFLRNTRLLIYPTLDQISKEIMTLENLAIEDNIRLLVNHLIRNSFLIPVKKVKTDKLHIRSRDVLREIAAGDASWIDKVPVYIAEEIISKQLFGYQVEKYSDIPLKRSDDECTGRKEADMGFTPDL